MSGYAIRVRYLKGMREEVSLQSAIRKIRQRLKLAKHVSVLFICLFIYIDNTFLCIHVIIQFYVHNYSDCEEYLFESYSMLNQP